MEKTIDRYAGLSPVEPGYTGSLEPDRDMKNRFSHWYNAIDREAVEAAGLRIPKTLIFSVPTEVQIAISNIEDELSGEKIKAWYDNAVLPALKEAKMDNRLLFVKNGVFSDKFHASHSCLADSNNLMQRLIAINQEAMCIMMGYDGSDELVVRERIMYNAQHTPCIYEGLPFRPEYRVFYDFDRHEPIFVHNYWDAEEAEGNLYTLTDKIIFEKHAPVIQAEYDKHKDEVMKMVSAAMKGVTGLHGPWSVDVMCAEGVYYLVDMATGELSAYWDCRPGNEEARAAELERRRKQRERN